MEFERPLVELEDQLAELKRLDVIAQPELAAEIASLEAEVEMLREALYSALSPWERVQVARHPDRPKTQDYVADAVHRCGGATRRSDIRRDEAIFAGLATLDGVKCVVLGHRKGKNTKENIRRNFGSPHPEASGRHAEPCCSPRSSTSQW